MADAANGVLSVEYLAGIVSGQSRPQTSAQRTFSVGYLGGGAHLEKIENVGLFWHFVDVLWLFIFPMLYLAGIR